MTVFHAEVRVVLKRGVLDPQGKAIEGALSGLGFEGVRQDRQGKTYDIELDAGSAAEAESHLHEMCEKLLANTVIEDFEIAVS